MILIWNCVFQGEQGLSGAHGIAGPPGRKVSTSPCYFPVLVAVCCLWCVGVLTLSPAKG